LIAPYAGYNSAQLKFEKVVMRIVTLLNLTRFALTAVLLSSLSAHATETRTLKIIATDSNTKQTGEVSLYNKTYAVIIGIDQYANLPQDKQLTYAVKDAKCVRKASSSAASISFG
jgi:hypothetical protein